MVLIFPFPQLLTWRGYYFLFLFVLFVLFVLYLDFRSRSSAHHFDPSLKTLLSGEELPAEEQETETENKFTVCEFLKFKERPLLAGE